MANINTKYTLTGQDKTKAAFASVNKSFDDTKKAALVTTAAIVGSAYAANRFANAIGAASDKMILMGVRMERFSGRSDAFAETVELANRLGVSIDEAGEGMTRFLISTERLNLPLETIKRMQENIIILGRAGGSAAAEMTSGMIQLGQGMASGRLQGEELRSVLENLPLVARAIADGMDTDIGKMRELASQGKITTQVIVDALQDVGMTMADLPETFGMATARMKTEWDLLLAHMGDSWQTSSAYNAITRSMRQFRRDQLGDDSDMTLKEHRAELERRIAWLEKFEGKKDSAELGGLRMELELLESKLRIQKQLDMVKRQSSAGAHETFDKASVELLEYTDELTKKATQTTLEYTRALFNLTNTDLDRFNEGFEVAEDTTRAAADATLEYTRALFNLTNTDLDRFIGEIEETSEYTKQAARNIQDSFADFLFDPFDEGLDGMLRGFIDTLRRMIAEAASSYILGAIFGGTPLAKLFGRAAGGPVMAGTPYIVGEKGPELFVPHSSGAIVPNHKMNGGGVTVVQHNNIDARGATQDVIRMLPGILAQNRAAAVNDVRDLVRRGSL